MAQNQCYSYIFKPYYLVYYCLSDFFQAEIDFFRSRFIFILNIHLNSKYSFNLEYTFFFSLTLLTIYPLNFIAALIAISVS